MPLAKAFRHGLPSGPDGEERPVDSNFSSGVGNPRKQGYGQGYPTGMGYPTGPSPQAPAVPSVARATAITAPQTPATAPLRSTVPLQRVAPRPSTPNAGGTITRNGVTTNYAPSPAANRDPNRPNLGGTIARNLAPGVKALTIVPPSPAAIRSQMTPALPANQPAALQPALNSPGAPVVSPTTSAAPQTESSNPLTGAGNQQMEGTTSAINPGAALGLNRRGNNVPQGADALPADPNTGGSGLYARKFASPRSASLYSNFVKRLFGDAA